MGNTLRQYGVIGLNIRRPNNAFDANKLSTFQLTLTAFHRQ